MAPETPARRSLDTIPVFNPATGEEVGAVPAASTAGVAEAVARARAAQKRWAKQVVGVREADVPSLMVGEIEAVLAERCGDPPRHPNQRRALDVGTELGMRVHGP